MHSYIQYNIIYKSQDRETIQVLVNREMDKDDVFYTHTHTHDGLLLSQSKRAKSCHCNNQ